ncbi:MAG: hypothetical protein HKM04_04505 [Legionellales bacterium]|nr:hypothetical protein [Legionellales bacterium]
MNKIVYYLNQIENTEDLDKQPAKTLCFLYYVKYLYNEKVYFQDADVLNDEKCAEQLVLLEIPGDNKNGCLYLGATFINKGLHTQGVIDAAKASGSGDALEINWPNQDMVVLNNRPATFY